jgi:hypothetical protein
MTVLSNTPSPNAAQVGAPKAAKKRPAPIERFPLRFHCAITNAMGNALKQLTGGNSLMSESDIGRLALHSYLLANSPLYARTMQQPTSGNRPNA